MREIYVEYILVIIFIIGFVAYWLRRGHRKYKDAVEFSKREVPFEFDRDYLLEAEKHLEFLSLVIEKYKRDLTFEQLHGIDSPYGYHHRQHIAIYEEIMCKVDGYNSIK